MKKVGFGIIGIGRQGLRLADHIREDIKPGKLIAVCRRSDSGHDYSKKHGVTFYSNYRDLLKDKNINAVIITTPSSFHGIHSIDALRAGKHVLVDKPIAATLDEGRQILHIAKKEKLTVAVNFPLRVNPVTMALKNNLKHIGKLKKIQIVVSHGPVRSAWQSDLKLSSGGVIMDLGSHYFDLITHITGCRPKEVNNAYSEDADVEHSGFIVLTYKDFSASIVLLRNQKLKKSIITCAGDKGFIFADYVMREVIVSNRHEVNEIKCPETNDFEVILHNMINAIDKKEKVIANGEAGLYSLRTALSVYKAIRTTRPVRL
jgi:predicted dehydrogenase